MFCIIFDRKKTKIYALYFGLHSHIYAEICSSCNAGPTSVYFTMLINDNGTSFKRIDKVKYAWVQPPAFIHFIPSVWKVNAPPGANLSLASFI